MNKTRIHKAIMSFFDNNLTGYENLTNTRCVVEGVGELIPDVGCWKGLPTRAQMVHPIANRCPPPEFWVEVRMVI
jgi:hypothetical protein